jgi:hypothetical protein
MASWGKAAGKHSRRWPLVIENEAKRFAVRFAFAVDVSAQEQWWLTFFLRVPGRAVRREILLVNALLFAAFEIAPKRRVLRFDFRFREFARQQILLSLDHRIAALIRHHFIRR